MIKDPRSCRHGNDEVISVKGDAMLLECLNCGERRINFTSNPSYFIEERDDLFNKYITDFE